MFYKIGDFEHPVQSQPDDKFVAIIPANIATNYDIVNLYIPKIPMLFTDCHFSKIEFFSDFTFGFISIPEILVSKRSVLCFIYTKDYIIFIDRDDFVLHHFTKMANTHTYHITSIGTVLYYLLDFIMYKDLEKINSLQQNLVQLELDVLNEKKTNQIREITEYRSRTMQLHHYYVQIEGICGDLTDETRHLMDDESKKLFNMLMRKISLYSHESEQIWEYTSQIREIYQQQLDVHQNTIMKFLTIVTTLFMPLTLIAGWYGMNFKYMPELHWKYGYPMVFILSCLLVIIMCIIFKKKKWW